ncbi:PIN domain-like protein [Coprinopsis sp. MPI-PUGE-AT-0042]|nr:PIN domain-like protein [Coprinopsis sp. MPI-PUGE-AT-0042]
MGIPNSWKEMEKHPLMRQISLTSHMMNEAKQRLERGEPLPTVGVDASPWLYEVQGATIGAKKKGASWARTGHSSEMKSLLTRLEQLEALPIIPVFFFDGNNRPATKRNTRVNSTNHYLLPSFRDLLRAFNIATYDAPGEAEADLADFNQCGKLDFVLTSNSDIFLFGARAVIRSPQDKSNRDLAQLYLIDDMRATSPGDNIRFSRAGWVFTAMLGGGDYNQRGLEGCGFTSAWALAESFLAHGLLDAITTYHSGDHGGASRCLRNWRQSLSEQLRTNSLGLLRSRHHFLAHELLRHANFPDLEIADLYANPVISRSEGIGADAHTRWVETLPDTALVTQQLYRVFHWDWSTIFDHLCSSIWPADCVRQLAKPDLVRSPVKTANNSLGACAVMDVEGIAAKHVYKKLPFRIFKVKVCLKSVVEQAIQVYEQETRTSLPPFAPGKPTAAATVLMPLPEPILRYGKPVAVAIFNDEKKLLGGTSGSTSRKRKQADVSGHGREKRQAFREIREGGRSVIVIDSDSETPSRAGDSPPEHSASSSYMPYRVVKQDACDAMKID